MARRCITLVLGMGMLVTQPIAAAASSTVAPDARDRSVLLACGSGQQTLHGTARQVAERALQRQKPWTMVELGRHLQAQGVPHPGARAWTLKAARVDRGLAVERLRRWLESHEPKLPRTCGVASVQDSERGEVLAVVTVPVFADLQRPIPRQVRQGSWVTVDALIRQWADEATVVVLGPSGAPRTIPTSFDRRQRQVVARFMADQQGAWLVQVVASTQSGPRPVLESRLFVGNASSTRTVVPGQSAGLGRSDADAIFLKLNDARRSEGLDLLSRDIVLDRVADAHVRQMMACNLVAHNVGDGTPPQRAAEAGERSREVGENVSRAASVALAHRALWESPSHRTNLLYPRYVRVGVAARRDARGRVWVTQVFAGR